jgi:peptidoglycan/LPS O-acetylase OafA/YrhL
MVVRPLAMNSPAAAWVMTAVYAVVTSILLVLAAFSGSGIERIYFAFCTTSAAFGLARQILGDGRMYVAVYIRVAMLACAVAAGIVILRRHGRGDRRQKAVVRPAQPGGITVSERQDG